MPSFSDHNVADGHITRTAFGKEVPTKTSLHELAQFFEPAVEGPPSPERLRQLSKQMKKASFLQRRPQAPTQGSGPAPLSASAAPYAIAEQNIAGEWSTENSSLSRYPSGRSSSSSTPSRERPDSIFFGKSLFQRKGMFSRENSGASSSAASFSSSEAYAEQASVTGRKDFGMPSLFSRRKPSGDDKSTQRKLQISGPFNFQHVLQNQRNQGRHVEARGSTPSPGPISAPSRMNTMESESTYSLTEGGEGQQDQTNTVQSHSASNSRTIGSSFGVRRFLKQVKSQDSLRKFTTTTSSRQQAPSPSSRPISPLVPTVPPRTSSRQSIIADGDVSLVSSLDRPQTAGGFRRPRPFSPVSTQVDQAASNSPGASSINDTDYDGEQASVPSTPEPSWPLDASSPVSPAYEKFLPDVPEEEEHLSSAHRIRRSLKRRSSSLRESHSVPLLRSFQPHNTGSDSVSLSNNALQGPTISKEETQNVLNIVHFRETWEDDIDYCYEHEVEANCDYQWNRSSLDASRDISSRRQGQMQTPSSNIRVAECTNAVNSLSMGESNERGLKSTADQSAHGYLANQSSSDSINANVPTQLVTHNFSLPNRKPSLLQLDQSASFNVTPMSGFHHDKSGDLERQTSLGQRGSVSSASDDSRSDSTDRHASANSVDTSFTYCSHSTTSLNKLAATSLEEMNAHKFHNTGLGTQENDTEESQSDTVPEISSFSLIPPRGKSLHKTHVSESMARPNTSYKQSGYEQRSKRPRARTSSLSATQTPPVGQYALFPRPTAKAIGERI